MQYVERDTRYDDTYQFAVVVFAISAVLDVVCVRSLLLAQQARKLGTVAGKHANGIKRSDEKATHFKNLPEKSVFVRKRDAGFELCEETLAVTLGFQCNE